MKQWVTAAGSKFCGSCGAEILEGAPMLLIAVEGAKCGSDGRGFRRCVECAGPAPPSLPKAPVIANTTKRAESVSAIGRRAYEDMRRDWKQKQAGDQ